MGHELGDARGRDQAAWLDLVARLELPAPADPAAAPWPDRENLANAAAGGQAAAGPADNPGPSRSAGLTREATPSSDDSGMAPGTGPPGSRPGKRAPADRSRVIRPANFPHLLPDSEGSAADPDGENAAAGWGPATDCDADPAEETRFDDPEQWRPTARNLSAEDYLNLADLGYLDYDTGDGDDRYVPPPLPPQPRLDSVAKAAWTALLGGPGYLFLATLLGWQVPGWAQLAAILAFITGFVVLVIRLGDGPSKRDGPDQGAVV